jgi:hypothetical protein
MGDQIELISSLFIFEKCSAKIERNCLKDILTVGKHLIIFRKPQQLNSNRFIPYPFYIDLMDSFFV